VSAAYKSAAYYEQLALGWRPESKSDKQFKLIMSVVVVVMLLLGIALSSISVPERKREVRTAVPERIANFILEKEKPKPKPVIEKPKPKIQIKPKPKAEVKKLPRKKLEQKPLTQTQKKARKKAAESGLLALGNELSDLMDTSDVSLMVSGKARTGSSAAAKPVASNKSMLTAGASQGSGGVKSSEYTTQVNKTQLSQREITQIKQSSITENSKTKARDLQRKSQSRSGGIRAEEDISIVFDQNKSKLYSIYNRERRSNPGLRGKIVLAITIAPDGKVIKVKMMSSELNNKKLESRLMSRIKLFNFGAKNVEQVTVTYPIEFLPS